MSTRTLTEAAAALGAGEVTSTELTQACLERAHRTAHLGAYLHLNEEAALAAAASSDARRARGEALGTLDGVPLALKDMFLTKGQPTTCASKLLEGFVSPYDGTAVERLNAAGAVLLGKLNMDEFAMGSSNEHSAYGPVRNPWDPERVPGGSSGGSAVAVAVGSALGTLGTDTGGSIRQPAALCGVVGLKPTYGRVSRYGVIAFASSLDQVGPFGRSVTDCALLLQAIAGFDPRDATSAQTPVPDYRSTIEQGAQDLRIGVPREYFGDGIDDEVRTAIDAALDSYRALGAQVVEVSLPHTEYAIPTYYVLCTAEASSNLARYDGVRYGQRRGAQEGLLPMYVQTRSEGFGPEVKRRIMLGTYALSAGYYDAYYGKAQRVRTLICRDFAAAFEQVDVLLTPTSPTPAFKLGERETEPLSMYLADIYTVGANLAGLPGISLPCGFTAGGLPIGMQLLGKPWDEALLLRAARAYEREHGWVSREPA